MQSKAEILLRTVHALGAISLCAFDIAAMSLLVFKVVQLHRGREKLRHSSLFKFVLQQGESSNFVMAETGYYSSSLSGLLYFWYDSLVTV